MINEQWFAISRVHPKHSTTVQQQRTNMSMYNYRLTHVSQIPKYFKWHSWIQNDWRCTYVLV